MPAPDLVATPGSDLANTYLDIDGCDAYHDTHLYGSTWFTATADQQAMALIWSTRLLDQHFEWDGEIANQTQALRWPRVATYDRDGRLLANDEIPTDIENATAELARHLIASDLTAVSSTSTGAVSFVQVGAISIKYADGTVPAQSVIPDAVRAMLTHLGTYQTASSGAVTMRRA